MTTAKSRAIYEPIRRVLTKATCSSNRGSYKRAEKGTWTIAVEIRWSWGKIREEDYCHQLVPKILSTKATR